jgi:hypothetical protein
MKVSVVKDEHGKVVATFEHTVDGPPTLKPALKPGEKVHEVEAPEDYKKNISTFYEQHSR